MSNDARIFLFTVLAVLAGVFGIAAIARAHHPDHAHADWFKSLLQPGTGTSCCDLSDGRSTRARLTPSGWEALTPSDEWVAIPPERVVRGKGNPTGHPVLFWTPERGVLCFVEPPLG